MIKYLILLAVVIIFGYVGYGLSAYYTNRSKFFKNLELLFEKIKTEIRFSQNKLIEILQSYPTQNKDVKKVIKNFIKCLEFDLEIKNENLFNDIKILAEEEKNILCIFFKSLGKFDAFNQTNQLDNQKTELARLHKLAEEEAKKYAPLYLKIGVIAGLVVALIFA